MEVTVKRKNIDLPKKICYSEDNELGLLLSGAKDVHKR